MKKKISLILLSTMFISTLVTPVNALKYVDLLQSNSNEVQLIDDLMQDKKFLADVKASMIEQYGEDYQIKLERNELAVKNANIIESKFTKDKLGERIYPDYIGGLYIDSDDNLVIQVVEQNIPDSQNIKYKNYESIINVDKNAKMKYVDYSYEELNEVYDTILNNFLGKVDNLTGLYVDVTSNRVVVELKELTDEKIDEFRKNVIDSSMVSFDKATIFEQISTVSPGGSFVSTNAKQGCSYGYRAKLPTGQTGIVSAAHCFKSSGDSISEIGMVSSYQNTGELDAAFVINTSGATLSNIISGTTITLGADVNSSLAVGQSISKYGYKTGLTSGTIKSVNYSYTGSNGTKYTKQIRAKLAATNGDSGGPAFQQSASNSSKATIVGIMHAANNDRTESLITKASLINQHFALSTY